MLCGPNNEFIFVAKSIDFNALSFVLLMVRFFIGVPPIWLYPAVQKRPWLDNRLYVKVIVRIFEIGPMVYFLLLRPLKMAAR